MTQRCEFRDYLLVLVMHARSTGSFEYKRTSSSATCVPLLCCSRMKKICQICLFNNLTLAPSYLSSTRRHLHLLLPPDVASTRWQLPRPYTVVQRIETHMQGAEIVLWGNKVYLFVLKETRLSQQVTKWERQRLHGDERARRQYLYSWPWHWRERRQKATTWSGKYWGFGSGNFRNCNFFGWKQIHFLLWQLLRQKFLAYYFSALNRNSEFNCI